MKRGMLLIAVTGMLMCACQDSPDDTDKDDEWKTPSAVEMVYSSLIRTFYEKIPDVEYIIRDDSIAAVSNGDISYQPSLGIVLDEANPYKRGAIYATYEEAVASFMKSITAASNIKSSVDSTESKILLSLGEYGNVGIHREDRDGVVARIDINLKDIHPYSVFCMPTSSFGDNGMMQDIFNFPATVDVNAVPNINYADLYSPGDVVHFKCKRCADILSKFHFVTKSGSQMESISSALPVECKGIVVSADPYVISILTDHLHSYTVSDHWKEVEFYYDIVSSAEWQNIFALWNFNSGIYQDLFDDSAKNANFKLSRNFVNIMRGISPDSKKDRICVDGNDLDAHRHLWKNLKKCLWSGAHYIKIDKLRNMTGGNDDLKAVEFARYAFHEGVNDKEKYYFLSMVKFTCFQYDEADLYHIYPIY